MRESRIDYEHTFCRRDSDLILSSRGFKQILYVIVSIERWSCSTLSTKQCLLIRWERRTYMSTVSSKPILFKHHLITVRLQCSHRIRSFGEDQIRITWITLISSVSLSIPPSQAYSSPRLHATSTSHPRTMNPKWPSQPPNSPNTLSPPVFGTPSRQSRGMTRYRRRPILSCRVPGLGSWG